MLELDRTEEVIREMDKLANEDHTHVTNGQGFRTKVPIDEPTNS